MDNSPDGIYFKDSGAPVLARQFVFRTGGGRRGSEGAGRPSPFGNSRGWRRCRRDEERRILQQLKPILDVVRSVTSAGKSSYTSETKAPIKGRSGQALGLVGISRDVTERVKTSEALRESEALLQQQTRILNSILDGMGDGVVVIGRDGSDALDQQRGWPGPGRAGAGRPGRRLAGGLRPVPRRWQCAAARNESAIPRESTVSRWCSSSFA